MGLLFFGIYWWGIENFKNKSHNEPEIIHKVFKGWAAILKKVILLLKIFA